MLYIAKSDLAKWCKRAGFSANNLWKKLQLDGITATEALYNLGSGVASLSTPMVICYVLTASSVAKLGFNTAMLGKQKAVENVAPQVL